MGNSQQILILGIGLVMLIALMFWPQWQARRRQQQQMRQLQPGDEIATVGGIIGKIAAVDTEKGRVVVEVAPGVQVTFVIAAISRTLTPVGSDDQGEETEPEPDEEAPADAEQE
jgi:preprotein translocase subunit YajC